MNVKRNFYPNLKLKAIYLAQRTIKHIKNKLINTKKDLQKLLEFSWRKK